MESQQGYLERLAGIEARIAQARGHSAGLLDRAAGLLAGRIGCPVDEAYAYLLRRAAERQQDSAELAAELLDAVEHRPKAGWRRLHTALEQALSTPRQSVAGRPVAHLTAPAPAPAGDFIHLMQQVMGAMTGEHAVLIPVHDDAGQLTDFEFVAVSPTVVDLSGRPGEQIVGRRVREVYPTVVDGPVWHAWREVLADGAQREVGPLPYVPASPSAHPHITITVRTRRVGPGLLNSWIRHDQEMRLAERMRQTEQLGNLGWGEWDLITGHVTWSDGLYRIYERDPSEGPLPPDQERTDLTLPEDEPIRRQAAEAFARGETVDISYRVRIGERIKHLRNVVDAVRDTRGRPTKIYGIVQDVTAPEVSRARLAEVEDQLREHERSLAAEHEVAAQLQQIVLPIPDGPFELPGLRVAVRYIPAEQASHVGGDWYHAAAAFDGSVVLAVGDVAGHGMYAATTMAQLRHALATLAATTTSNPATLLGHLNRLLYGANGSPDGAEAGTATAVVARYHAATGVLEWAQAGHPAVLRTRAGSTAELDRPSGPMLGVVREATFATARAVVEFGDLLLFYTDGLIEHRRHSLSEGLDAVVTALNDSATSRQPLADLLARLQRANPDDDTCVLAARRLPLTASAADLGAAGHGPADQEVASHEVVDQTADRTEPPAAS